MLWVSKPDATCRNDSHSGAGNDDNNDDVDDDYVALAEAPLSSMGIIHKARRQAWGSHVT